MKTTKKALALLLALLVLACRGADTASAEGEDFAFLLEVQKCDPATKTVLDGDADAVSPGDIVAVTFSILNNTGSNYRLNALTAYLLFDAERLSLYSTGNAGDVPLWRDGYADLENTSFVTGVTDAGELSEGTAYSQFVMTFAQVTPVPLRVSAYYNPCPLCRILFRVRDDAPDGEALFSFNDDGVENLAATLTASGEKEKASLDLTGEVSLSIADGALPVLPEYAYQIEEIRVDGDGGVSVDITNVSGSGGTVMAAAYSREGQMLRCAMAEIDALTVPQGERDSVALEFEAMAGETVKAVVVGSVTCQPLSAPLARDV